MFTYIYSYKAALKYTTNQLKKVEITINNSKFRTWTNNYAFSTPVAVKDKWVDEPKFTSLFLLEHSQQSFELFNIHSEEEYRLMMEINKAFDNFSTSTSDNNSAVYRINDTHAIIVADSNFKITNAAGEILGEISISNFARSSRAGC